MAGDSGDTIRDLLSGFTSMQKQLGLLPQNSGQMPMGVPLNQPPPPPPMLHPSDFGQMMMQQHQGQAHQTIQAAQMTRYIPPPSAPMPGGGGGFNANWGAQLGAAQAGAANPYAAQMMGGMPGMPHMGMMTQPQFGVYRGAPMAAPMTAPPMYGSHVPPVGMPFAPQMPNAHFMTPTMQNYQMMQARQAHSVGNLGGYGGGALEIGGSLLGAAFGPLGSMAGGAIGRGIGAMGIDPVLGDIRHGRQMQNVMAPWMVSGGNLNPYTGQGMDRQSGQATANALRTMTRDTDFQRSTGFNTQDIHRITQLSADQGLLQTAQNPEQIASQVKNISKAIKALVQITGDPDVRNAIASLGQMRQMGFEGLSAQTGAVANRAAFSRMAGVSQGQMAQFEAAGAMQATQMGLSGATGMMATRTGYGMANVATGSGAVGGLALARAGGQQGLAQSLSQMQMASTAFDPYLMAAVQKDANGQMGLNMDAYRSNMGKSLSEVMRIGGDRMGSLGPQGMLEFRRRRAELGERAAQQMSPTELMMMPLRQARALQADTPDLDIGSAFEVLGGKLGMSSGATQAMKQVYTDPRTYNGLMQQLGVQQRDASDRERGRRNQFRQSGYGRAAGDAIRRFGQGASDAMGAPFAYMAERSQRVDEDVAAEARGESVRRYSQSELIQSGADQALAIQGGQSRDYARLTGATGDPGQTGFAGRFASEVGARLGLNSRNSAQRMVRIASESGGRGRLLGLFNDPFVDAGSAQARVSDVEGAASMIRAGASRTAAQTGAMATAAQRQGRLVIGDAAKASKFNVSTAVVDMAQLLRTKIKGKGDAALKETDIKDVVVKTLIEKGMSPEAAEQEYSQRKEFYGGEITRNFTESGNREEANSVSQALNTADAASGVDPRKRRENIDAQLQQNLTELGVKRTLTGKDEESVKNLIKTTDPKVLALAAAKHANNYKEVQRILGSLSPEEASNISRQAGVLANNKDIQGMLKQIGSTAGNLEHRIRETKETIGIKMESNAFEKAAQQIGKDLGQSSLGKAKSEEDLLSSLAGMENLSGIKNLKQREAALAYQKARSSGDAAGMKSAVDAFKRGAAGSGPSAKKEIVGGVSGGESEALSRSMEDLRNVRDELGGTPEGKAQAVAADAALAMGDVAKKFDNSIDKLVLYLDRNQHQ